MEKNPPLKTLAQQGAVLPLGTPTPDGIALARDISCRPWRMKEEVELGALRDKNREANLAQYVSMVLATMCTRLGGHDLEKMKYEERLVVISQMFMADVFYAYIWLRTQTLGNEMALKIACPACKKKSDLTADLGTVEVKAVEKHADAEWDYTLSTPFTIRGIELKSLRLGPARWNAVESIPSNVPLNSGRAKAEVIRCSIVGYNDVRPVVLGDNELDELGKRDIETLAKRIDEHAVGPMMVLEEACPNPKCGEPMRFPLDWNYDSFFGSSSR